MDHEITTTTRTTTKVVFDLSDEPVMEDWQGISHRGKTVKLEVMSFDVVQVDDEEPRVGRLKIGGWLVKKDGTVSATTWVEAEIWGNWVKDVDGGRFHRRETECFGHLIERARAVALEVLGS